MRALGGPCDLFPQPSQDICHVVLGLGNVGYRESPVYAGNSSVVSAERQSQVSMVAIQQLPQKLRAGGEAFLRIKWIVDFELRLSRRHQLHQALRTLGRDRTGTECRLLASDFPDYSRVDTMLAGDVVD